MYIYVICNADNVPVCAYETHDIALKYLQNKQTIIEIFYYPNIMLQ